MITTSMVHPLTMRSDKDFGSAKTGPRDSIAMTMGYDKDTPKSDSKTAIRILKLNSSSKNSNAILEATSIRYLKATRHSENNAAEQNWEQESEGGGLKGPHRPTVDCLAFGSQHEWEQIGHLSSLWTEA